MQDVLTAFADRVKPGHTAVVVVDIQNDFCAPDGYGGKVLGRDVSNNVPMAEANMALVDAARSCGSREARAAGMYVATNAATARTDAAAANDTMSVGLISNNKPESAADSEIDNASPAARPAAINPALRPAASHRMSRSFAPKARRTPNSLCP